MKKSLILGICGQDGSYLAEFLLEKGYHVVGLYRRSSTPNFSRIQHIKHRLELVEGDVTDFSLILNLVSLHQFDEIYNLAAQSHVHTSFSNPIYTTEVDYGGCLNILEVLAYINQVPKPWKTQPKFYQASTSEMFGSNYTKDIKTEEELGGNLEGYEPDSYGMNFCVKKYQDENTPFLPNSPYAIAKLAAHHAVRMYRDAYKIFSCSGILFNHESPRRGEEFVTKKIVKWLSEFVKWKKQTEDDNPGGIYYDYTITNSYISSMRLNNNKEEYGHKESWACGPKFPKLKLGNIDAYRDWGYAKDYVEGMWLMLQQENPQDYVLATGETHTVREFLHTSFSLFNLNWEDFVEIDESLKRPLEVPYLRGNPAKANRELGWKAKTSFSELVKLMVENG